MGWVMADSLPRAAGEGWQAASTTGPVMVKLSVATTAEVESEVARMEIVAGVGVVAGGV